MDISMTFLIATIVGLFVVVYVIGCVIKVVVNEIEYAIAVKKQDRAMLEYYASHY